MFILTSAYIENRFHLSYRDAPYLPPLGIYRGHPRLITAVTQYGGLLGGEDSLGVISTKVDDQRSVLFLEELEVGRGGGGYAGVIDFGVTYCNLCVSQRPVASRTLSEFASVTRRIVSAIMRLIDLDTYIHGVVEGGNNSTPICKQRAYAKRHLNAVVVIPRENQEPLVPRYAVDELHPPTEFLGHHLTSILLSLRLSVRPSSQSERLQVSPLAQHSRRAQRSIE